MDVDAQVEELRQIIGTWAPPSPPPTHASPHPISFSPSPLGATPTAALSDAYADAMSKLATTHATHASRLGAVTSALASFDAFTSSLASLLGLPPSSPPSAIAASVSSLTSATSRASLASTRASSLASSHAALQHVLDQERAAFAAETQRLVDEWGRMAEEYEARIAQGRDSLMRNQDSLASLQAAHTVLGQEHEAALSDLEEARGLAHRVELLAGKNDQLARALRDAIRGKEECESAAAAAAARAEAEGRALVSQSAQVEMELRGQVQELSAAYTAVTEERDHAHSLVTELHRSVRSLEERLESVTVRGDALEGQTREVSDQLVRANKARAQAENDSASARQELARAQDNYAALATQVQIMRERYASSLSSADRRGEELTAQLAREREVFQNERVRLVNEWGVICDRMIAACECRGVESVSLVTGTTTTTASSPSPRRSAPAYTSPPVSFSDLSVGPGSI